MTSWTGSLATQLKQHLYQWDPNVQTLTAQELGPDTQPTGPGSCWQYSSLADLLNAQSMSWRLYIPFTLFDVNSLASMQSIYGNPKYWPANCTVRELKPAILLLSVALFAALTGHAMIDILGDFMLAHDTYDDMDHPSRTIVALVTLGLTILGIGLGFNAAIREARGSENAFCTALRGALPRSQRHF